MRSRYTLLILGVLACVTHAVAQAAYNPMQIVPGNTPQVLDQDIQDSNRARVIPIRVYLPQTVIPTPVILFSPGLGGSRTGYAYLAKHWAACGYAVVVMQHPGSDDKVWQGKSRSQAIAAMHAAASGQNFLQRVRDVSAVLNYLSDQNKRNHSLLMGRLDLSKIGMAGHSFGAVTTEAISGEHFRGRALFADPRIKAALALSPSSPRHGTPAQAFGQITLPWMLMTGTKDIGLLGLGAQDVASRLAVYSALPPGHKYELILANAEHMAFSDRTIASEDGKRNPNDHKAILALSTAFWDAMLLHRRDAQTWLNTSAYTVLKPGDHWQHK